MPLIEYSIEWNCIEWTGIEAYRLRSIFNAAINLPRNILEQFPGNEVEKMQFFSGSEFGVFFIIGF